MKILAIIPSRGGSVEIPRKNIIRVDGEPLQHHTIKAALNAKMITRTIVSTDDNEIAKHAKKMGAENYKDDYSFFLPVFPTGDLKKSKKTHSYMDKAIQKGSIVIQRHSMKIKGKEYCKWIDENYLMVGKGYFYKGDFDEAIKTFNFIKNEYKKNEIRFEYTAPHYFYP